MRILLSKEQVIRLAQREATLLDADEALGARLAAACDRGWMDQDDLYKVAKWKWRGGRTRQLVGQNTAEEVREATAASFVAKTERLRIGCLLALHGVNWPMASVILHFAYPSLYPMLDFRSMRTVGASGGYNFDKWQRYTDLCRATASELGVSLRTLDKALFSYDASRS